MARRPGLGATDKAHTTDHSLRKQRCSVPRTGSHGIRKDACGGYGADVSRHCGGGENSDDFRLTSPGADAPVFCAITAVWRAAQARRWTADKAIGKAI